MGSIYKKTSKRPTPDGAEIVVKRGKNLATWTGKDGRKYKAAITEDGQHILAESVPWYLAFVDENGLRVVENSHTTEKDVAKQILKAREKRVAEMKSGLLDPATERIKEAVSVPMGEHIKKFIQGLADKGRSEKHISTVQRHIKQTTEVLGWDRISKMRSEQAQEYFSTLKSSTGRPFSAKTKNHYMGSLKSFSAWLYRTKRANTNEMRDLTAFAKDDGHHRRRVLSDEEMSRLLAAAANGPEVQELDGPTRVVLYVLAASTGYRRKELGSLTPESFDLDRQVPIVNLGATSTKNGQAAMQPIPPKVAEMMRAFIQGAEPGKPIFTLWLPSGRTRKTAVMMRSDLKRARSQWIDEATSQEERSERAKSNFLRYKNSLGEVADLHSLRHRYVTELAKAGVPMILAKELARHSDIRLTANVYSHVNLEEKAAAISTIKFSTESINGSAIGSARPASSDTKRQALALTDDRDTPRGKSANHYKTRQKDTRKTVAAPTDLLESDSSCLDSIPAASTLHRL